jgi:hypothetical protein
MTEKFTRIDSEAELWIFREFNPKWSVRPLKDKDKPLCYNLAFPMYKGMFRTIKSPWLNLFVFGVN